MASGTCGKNLVWSLDNGTLTISGEGDMYNYRRLTNGDYPTPWYSIRNSIRKIIIGDNVTSIGEGAFAVCRNFTNVTIPNSVTYIGDEAFFSCGLKEITIPEGVTSIGEEVFNSSDLTKITLPDGLISIGYEAFRSCDFEEITIPDSVTRIDFDAFSYCKNLREITIPDSVTEICDDIFYCCENLRKIKIPDSVTFIGNWAFSGCENLKSITIPDSVTSIGKRAFSDCVRLKEITIPESVTEIGEEVFADCTSLKKIYYKAGSSFEAKLAEGNNAELIPVAPKNVKWRVENITLTVGGADEIKDYSKETPPWNDFLNTVQRIVIEDGVKKISANAFSNILRLEHVIIPASLKTIGDFAFKISYCGNIEVNGGRNVIWSLDNGTLLIKKNPAAPADADFSTGYEMWKSAENNIKAIKIECGVIPSKRFFEWLWQSGRDVQIKFV